MIVSKCGIYFYMVNNKSSVRRPNLLSTFFNIKQTVLWLDYLEIERKFNFIWYTFPGSKVTVSLVFLEFYLCLIATESQPALHCNIFNAMFQMTFQTYLSVYLKYRPMSIAHKRYYKHWVLYVLWTCRVELVMFQITNFTKL